MTTAGSALIDSHCHLHFPPLGDDIPAVLDSMRANDVGEALVVATARAEVATVHRLAQEHSGVLHAACGVHPCTDEEVPADELRDWCAPDGVVAVGETGLDYFHDSVSRPRQKERFALHIALARELNKPLIIHVRDSFADVLDVLKAHPDVGGVMHCFTGGPALARQALDIGFYVSFSGIVSFKNAREVHESAAFVPSDRYLVETDAPYLAPVPFRGKTNTPGYVRHVAEAVAAVRGCALSQVAEESTANFRRLFFPAN